MNYSCSTQRRKNAIRSHPNKNGIDYLEVLDDETAPAVERQTTLYLHFLKPLAEGSLSAQNILIKGGERIQNLRVTAILPMNLASPPGDDNVLRIKVSEAGDFSTYTLYLVQDNQSSDKLEPPTGYDLLLSKVDFSFKVACFNDFDCQPAPSSIKDQPAPPQINYLAKDYASFKQLMLDRMTLLMPGWTDRNPADLGVMLVELLAYTADYLSYRQDAITTEAYLGTARKRISVRRHARLVDYWMHDGCNARAWVQFKLGPDTGNVLLKKGEGEQSTKLLTKTTGLPTAFRLDSPEFAKALKAGVKVFELMHDVKLYEQHNEIHFYTWGEEDCCLPKGATHATLLNNNPEKPLQLKAGDLLLLAEVMGPETGIPQDADTTRRHVVRLTEVRKLVDTDIGYYGGLPANQNDDSIAEDQTISIMTISWDVADALPFSLCISRGGKTNISVAMGNIALVDHGITIRDHQESSLLPHMVSPPRLQKVSSTSIPTRYYPKLVQSPLTYAAPLLLMIANNESGSTEQKLKPQNQPAADLMRWSVRDALPSIHLWESNDEAVQWHPKRDLLIDSAASDQHFVVEVESDGTSYLRFGNDKNGFRPNVETTFKAQYRLGNGKAGNIGANTIAHLVTNDANVLATLPAENSSVSNPLPALGGKEKESIEEVKLYAPQAFRTQERAVTPADYEAFAKQCKPDIQRASANYRWTGSWKTAFITVDRFGGLAVDNTYETELQQCLEQYRLAGFDLQVEPPIYVSLEISMEVCVDRAFFAHNVRQVLLEVFSNRILPDGRRGVFHPDNFSFGQPVYLSRLYHAAQSVQGVNSVEITQFQRQEIPGSNGLETGRLDFGRREIARLDNDPNFPTHGLFNLTMKGGR